MLKVLRSLDALLRETYSGNSEATFVSGMGLSYETRLSEIANLMWKWINAAAHEVGILDTEELWSNGDLDSILSAYMDNLDNLEVYFDSQCESFEQQRAAHHQSTDEINARVVAPE